MTLRKQAHWRSACWTASTKHRSVARDWADGGQTRIDNLVLLCTQHHRAVHEGGFQLRRDHQGDLYFLTPRGKAIPACGRYETLDGGTGGVSAESLPPVSAETTQMH